MRLSLLTSSSPLDHVPASRVLGSALIGANHLVEPTPWPQQRVRAPLLGAGDALRECWLVDGDAPCAGGEREGVAWRRHGDVIFGVIELPESAGHAQSPGAVLQQVAHRVYARILRLLDAQGLPNIWRMWNYIADINAHVGALERYRQFNLGRGEAITAGVREQVRLAPAACALGVASGPLSVAFLAGSTPVVTVENPRQVSAYRYPRDYGPRSPDFSRAALVGLPEQEILFVSGTASIVGHQSVHLGDVRAQAAESLNNIAAVLDAASAKARGGAFALRDLAYRAYVRHAADLAAVRQVLTERLGDAPVVYLQADVCRADLLVEIEGQAIRDCS